MKQEAWRRADGTSEVSELKNARAAESLFQRPAAGMSLLLSVAVLLTGKPQIFPQAVVSIDILPGFVCCPMMQERRRREVEAPARGVILRAPHQRTV